MWLRSEIWASVKPVARRARRISEIVNAVSRGSSRTGATPPRSAASRSMLRERFLSVRQAHAVPVPPRLRRATHEPRALGRRFADRRSRSASALQQIPRETHREAGRACRARARRRGVALQALEDRPEHRIREGARRADARHAGRRDRQQPSVLRPKPLPDALNRMTWADGTPGSSPRHARSTTSRTMVTASAWLIATPAAARSASEN